jgi:hypothetical protein
MFSLLLELSAVVLLSRFPGRLVNHGAVGKASLVSQERATAARMARAMPALSSRPTFSPRKIRARMRVTMRLQRGGERRDDGGLALVAIGGEGGDDAEAVERTGGKAGPDHRRGHGPIERFGRDDPDRNRNECGAPREIGQLGRNVIGGNFLRRAEDAPADHRAERVEHPRVRLMRRRIASGSPRFFASPLRRMIAATAIRIPPPWMRLRRSLNQKYASTMVTSG